MDRRIFLSGTAAVIAVAAGGYFYLRRNRGAGADLIGVNAGEAENAGASDIPDMTLGAADAPVTLIEYASYTCPHCANFHKTIFPQLKADYIDTGKVRFIHREVFFDRFGLWAAIVARCGGEDRYFGIADILYEEQSAWLGGDTPAGVADNLRLIGKRAGLTGETLDACLGDADRAEAMVANYRRQADKDGINSTPSFVIDGRKYSNMSYDELRGILDGKLGN